MLQSRIILFILLMILQLPAVVLSAQQIAPEDIVISINDGYLSINGVQADMPEPIEWWVEQLGPYSRKYGKRGAYYVWDDLGISISRMPDGFLRAIKIEFRDIPSAPWESSSPLTPRGRDAIKNFPGTFIFNDIQLDETVPLYEYNHKYRKLGGKKRFKQGSMAIRYYFPGLFLPGTKKTFDVSARVGEDNCIYRLEFGYGEREEWPTEEEVREANRR